MDLISFDPVLYSDAENRFLLDHLGEPTIVAIRAITDRAVNPAAIKPVLDRVNELEQLKQHEGLNWCGIEPMKASITKWLETNAKWKADHKRTGKKAPRWPSMYSYDAKGRPHRSGPGADSDRVRTYFGPAGERIPFEVLFQPDDLGGWTAPGFTEASADPLLFVDAEHNRIECRVPNGEGGFCGHTESYKPESRASYTAARARMSKHLRKPGTVNPDLHRELHTNEFGN